MPETDEEKKKRLIGDQSSDPLVEKELKEVRYAKNLVIYDMVPPKEIETRHHQHDKMWVILRPLVDFKQHWPVWFVTVLFIVWVGGADLLRRVYQWAEGFL